MTTMNWKYDGKSYSYDITSEDKLNLARAVNFEGPPESLVLWTLLQRFAMLHSQGYYQTLSKFIKAYVQPINPRWFSSGDLYQDYVRGKSKSFQQKELLKAKAREQKAQTTYGQIDSNIRYYVERVLGGDRQSPNQTTLHYWASRATSKMKPDEARMYNQERRPNMELVDSGYGFGPGVNVFFTMPGADKLSAVKIKDSMNGKTLIATSVVGAVLYLLSRYWG